MSIHDVVFQTQGQRKEQEDTYVIFEYENKLCVALFDGHSCSSKDNLSRDIALKLPKMFELFFQKRPLNETNIEEFFRRLDLKFFEYRSGTCACIFFAEKDNVYLTMVGDTEAVVVQDDILSAFALHNFKNVKEFKRYQELKIPIYAYRYCGLNVSRAFGDRELRMTEKHPLAPIPSIQHFKANSILNIFMFTDGIREKVKNDNIAYIVQQGFDREIQKLLDTLKGYNFIDNATLIAFQYSYKNNIIEDLQKEIQTSLAIF